MDIEHIKKIVNNETTSNLEKQENLIHYFALGILSYKVLQRIIKNQRSELNEKKDIIEEQNKQISKLYLFIKDTKKYLPKERNTQVNFIIQEVKEHYKIYKEKVKYLFNLSHLI